MEDVVLLFSGGLDSTVLLYDLKRFYSVHPILFDYGQRHKKELDCASKICDNLGIVPKIVDLQALNTVSESALTRSNIIVPEGASFDDPIQSQTVVPNRNAIMLLLATSYAQSVSAKNVFFGCHSGDFDIYPDCRIEFVDLLNSLIRQQGFDVEVKAPYIYMNKADIVSIGIMIKVPFNDTWTCYQGGDEPCGKCGACIERQEAFNNI